MKLKNKVIGIGLTGSHCTIPTVIPYIYRLSEEGADLYAVLSTAVSSTDTRFNKAQEVREELIKATKRPLIESIVDAEPIGPEGLLDVFVIVPCSGNTLAKMACGITDTPVLMGAKAQLRNEKPVVIGISTNDGMSANWGNIGVLLNRKHVYFVPFGQDNPEKKRNSLVAHMDLLLESIVFALKEKQIQPVLISQNSE